MFISPKTIVTMNLNQKSENSSMFSLKKKTSYQTPEFPIVAIKRGPLPEINTPAAKDDDLSAMLEEAQSGQFTALKIETLVN